VLLISPQCFSTFETDGKINGMINQHDSVDLRKPDLRLFPR